MFAKIIGAQYIILFPSDNRLVICWCKDLITYLVRVKRVFLILDVDDSILVKVIPIYKCAMYSIMSTSSRRKGRMAPDSHYESNVYFGTFCILLSLSTSGWGYRERNAWMETTIIHQSLLPPLPSSSPANAFAKDILFTQCDLFSTDTP